MKGISLFQGIFFGVLILCAVIGLFVFANYTNTGGAAASVGTVVVWGTLPAAEVDVALTQAVKADNSLKGVTYVEKPAASLATDLAAAIATGQGPDLVITSEEELLSLEPFLTPIALANISARAFTDTFAEGGQVFAAPGGKGYWGLPLAIDPLVLFYNRAILSSTGVAAPPATWEALTGLVPQVAAYTPTKQVTRGLIALGTYDNVHDARGILSTLFLQTAVPITGEDATGRVSADLGLASAASAGGPPGPAVVRFYTQFADPNKLSYTWNASLPDSEQAFQNGDLALYLGFASEARFLTAANPNLDFAVAPTPEPATASTKTTYGRVYAAMIPRGAKNAAGAYKAAALLAGAPEQAAL
ncbi:MAG: extracellular solute-binding protein, partial [Patescibacteria group bacterium]|nr:extracellular solute-binding protein [Patescibacteria group bacterium]